MLKPPILIIASVFLSIVSIHANPVCDIDEDGAVGIGEAIYALRQGDLENAVTALQVVSGILPPAYPARERYHRLAGISHWFYYLGFNPDEATLLQMENSTYDMIVMEPLFTEKNNTDYPIADVVNRFHTAAHPKLVIAYVDIGQAEEWRSYWQPGWGIGNPSWIVADDPDGWEGNYPVKYWHADWKSIWIGSSGYLQQIINAGFDGIYLDWVEAYSDENVLTAAALDAKDSEAEMIAWVGELASFGRNQNVNFLVIGQNAAELAARDDYLAIIDAVSQEQTWFDGASDNTPPGDCPLPATDSDIDTTSYENLLIAIDTASNQTNDGCHRMFVDFPDSTLHVSSEMYVNDLTLARNKCEVVFTIDYAVIQSNVDQIYSLSRNLGFIPFVSERNLDIYLAPKP